MVDDGLAVLADEGTSNGRKASPRRATMKHEDENGRGAISVFRYYNYYRPAILVLLKGHESHGYELVTRLTELGFQTRDTASLYGVLRGMEAEALVGSLWKSSDRGGPPRRVYTITDAGEQYLRDVTPHLVRQRYALGAMLENYRELARQEPRPRVRGRSVLVVDDDQDVRQMLWLLLEERGWIVDEAASAEHALETRIRRGPDVIVLDQRLAGMSGIDVARGLLEKGFAGPIVLHSVDADAWDEANALGLHTLATDDFGVLVAHFAEHLETRDRVRREH